MQFPPGRGFRRYLGTASARPAWHLSRWLLGFPASIPAPVDVAQRKELCATVSSGLPCLHLRFPDPFS